MATHLLLDKDRRAINVIEWDGITEHLKGDDVAECVPYEGSFNHGWVFDGTELVNPDPMQPKSVAAPTIADGEAMSVLS
jgi:hypothetical protein